MDKQQNSDQQTLKRKPKRRHPILRTLTVILLVALFLAGGYAARFYSQAKRRLRKHMIQLVLRRSVQISMAKNRSVFFY